MTTLNGRSIITCSDARSSVEPKKTSLLSFRFKIMAMEGERSLFISGEFHLTVSVSQLENNTWESGPWVPAVKNRRRAISLVIDIPERNGMDIRDVMPLNRPYCAPFSDLVIWVSVGSIQILRGDLLTIDFPVKSTNTTGSHSVKNQLIKLNNLCRKMFGRLCEINAIFETLKWKWNEKKTTPKQPKAPFKSEQCIADGSSYLICVYK